MVAVKRETVASVGAEGTVAGTCLASASALLGGVLVVTVTFTSYWVPLTRPVIVEETVPTEVIVSFKRYEPPEVFVKTL